jgi:hypothetical protein
MLMMAILASAAFFKAGTRRCESPGDHNGSHFVCDEVIHQLDSVARSRFLEPAGPRNSGWAGVVAWAAGLSAAQQARDHKGG